MGSELRGVEWVARLSSDDLARQVGDSALQRGRGYHEAGAVLTLATGAQGTMLLATVQGTRSSPYQVLVRRLGAGLDADAADHDDASPSASSVSRWTSQCSCPVGRDCKHVVAVILQVRSRVVAEILGGPDADAPPAWQSVLRGLAEPAPAVAAHADDPIALVVQADAVPPTAYQPAVTRIRVRPSIRSRPGRWSKVTSWSEVTDAHPGLARARLRVEHVVVCQDLVRLARRHQPTFSYWSGSSPVELGDLGPGVWDILREAVDLGMPLLSREGLTGIVALAPGRAAVEVDVVRAAGGLRVAPVLRGADVLDDDMVLLGAPAHGVAVLGEPMGSRDLQPIVLHQLEGTLDPAVGDLMRHGDVDVPEPDVGRFLALYLPGLRGRATVLSSDGSVTLPERAAPRLLVRLATVGPLRLQVGFAFRYQAGDAVTDLPMALSGSDALLRDRPAERALVDRVAALGRIPGCKVPALSVGGGPLAERVVLTRGAALDFLTGTLPLLEADDDVVVEGAETLTGFEESDDELVLRIGVQDDDRDWFGLQLSMRLGDEDVPFVELYPALVRGDEQFVLPSGAWFRLDRPDLQRLRELIAESREIVDHGPHDARVSRFDLGLVDELASLGVQVDQSVAWQEAVAALADLDSLVAPPLPDGLTATLRPYQQEGFGWLATLWRTRLGGILADDMGLGKTVQALALLTHLQEAGELTEPALVVAPTSVVAAWTEQAAQFAPDLPLAVVDRTSRARRAPLPDVIAGAAVVVTTYSVLRLDEEAFAAQPWSVVLLDEAQMVKNPRAKTHQAARRLTRRMTVAITGTPLENSLMDLWSMLALTAPGLYPDAERFVSAVRRPVESGNHPEVLDRLRSRIRPLLLRRTKEEVAADLPPKQVQLLPVQLDPAHRRIYDRHLQRERQRMLQLLVDPESNRIAILASLTRMRQLALHPGLVDDEHHGVPSAKLTLLVEHIAELAAEGHRALVFSQFTSFLRLAREALTSAGIDTCYLDGSTRDRPAVVREFREGDAPAFLISLKAGGTGLTLTEADYVFVLDPWWNPATENQAIDRAHRIGQDKPVFVYRLASADTVEEKVLALQARKRDLFDQVMDGGALGGAITADDIRGLLGA